MSGDLDYKTIYMIAANNEIVPLKIHLDENGNICGRNPVYNLYNLIIKLHKKSL